MVHSSSKPVPFCFQPACTATHHLAFDQGQSGFWDERVEFLPWKCSLRVPSLAAASSQLASPKSEEERVIISSASLLDGRDEDCAVVDLCVCHPAGSDSLRERQQKTSSRSGLMHLGLCGQRSQTTWWWTEHANRPTQPLRELLTKVLSSARWSGLKQLGMSHKWEQSRRQSLPWAARKDRRCRRKALWAFLPVRLRSAFFLVQIYSRWSVLALNGWFPLPFSYLSITIIVTTSMKEPAANIVGLIIFSTLLSDNLMSSSLTDLGQIIKPGSWRHVDCWIDGV